VRQEEEEREKRRESRMSGYPGFQGNQLGGQDVEMGQVPGGSRIPAQPGVAFVGQQGYNTTANYGYPPEPTKPQNYQQQYAGYGQPQQGGIYTAPPVQPPPPAPPAPSQYIQNMDLAVRHGFIRKVYGILFVQLLLTFGIVAIFSYIPAVQNYAINNSWLMGVSIAAVFAVMIAMTCCPGNLMRRFPHNLILLMVFTLFEGFALGSIAATYACDSVQMERDGNLVCIYSTDGAPAVNGRMSVLLAMGITVAVVVVLSIFACQTKYDFTGFGPYLLAGLLIFIVFFFIAGFWLRFNKVYNLVYACIGVLIFSGLLIYNTQMVVGGKNRKYSLSPDDYVLGALTIYLDIINLFMFILSIIGLSR
jgi:hypothetical protein